MKFRIIFLCFILPVNFTILYADTYYGNGIKNNPNHIKNYEHKDAKTLTTLDAAKQLKFELGAVLGGVTYLGLKSWNWGSSNSFKVNNEGWLSMNTHSAGADKFGHMYSSYVINELFTKRLIYKTNNVSEAAKKSALFSTGIMLWVEVFDGFSDDHGFSYEDLVFNSAGIGLSYLKNTVPGLDDKLDLRVEYHPTHNSDHPITDFSGYTYSLVTKLGGFKKLQNTPLRYMELQLGYHTEGFKKDDEKYFKEKKAEVLFGIGIDLSEVFFKPLKKRTNNSIVEHADTFFRYYQAPGIYISTPINERKRPFQ